MPVQKLRPSFTFDQDRLDQLRAVVPEAFADGKINWEVLREALGEYLEDEDADAEHFGLFWPGKRAARRLASQPSKGTLVPQPGLGVNEDTTRNIFIEGENLEVLKLLQKSYAGRVKMIYIDPPYNTGNDFIYSDDYSEPLESYLQRTGQADEKGQLVTSNPKGSGRFHSNWLNMMYPRLRLARQLLCDSGVICVSIDDHESHYLQMVLNEIFGEENFIARIVILTNPKGRVLGEHFAQCHDYLMIYSKSPLDNELALPKTDEEIAEQYPEIDEGGRYRLLELRNTHRQFGRFNRPNLFFPLYINPDNGAVSLEKTRGHIEVLPLWDDGFEGCWTWGPGKVEKDNHLLVGKEVRGRWKVYRKSYAYGDDGEVAQKKLQTIWSDNKFHTEKGQASFDDLIPGRIFPSPKPVDLIKILVELATTDDDIVLDFFAGSCTTAQATLEICREKVSKRRFICVQLPEMIDLSTPSGKKALNLGLRTIADIGRERIRRVIAKMQAETEDQLDLNPNEDLGFKCYRLDCSHFKGWQDITPADLDQIEMAFDRFESPLVEGWQPEALLTEILLIEGFPLDSRVAQQEGFAHNQVYLVISDFHQHRLFVCLDEAIADETVAQLDLQDQDIFVCLDTAITDEAKLRLSDAGNLHVI